MRLARFALAAILALAIAPLTAQTPATSAPAAVAAPPDTMVHKQITPSKGLHIVIYRKVNDTVNEAMTNLSLLQIAVMPHKSHRL